MATTCADPAVLWGLFSAAFGGNLPKVKTLLNTNSLSSDVTDPKTGSTALLWASTGGSLEVVEWLVKEAGAKATHHNKDNCTAFYYACEHCHKPVAEFLVGQRGVNINDKDNSSGHSALHRLCIAGQTREAKAAEAKAIISWLIAECDVDVNAVDLAGRLPGEANLSIEAPNLQPTALAIEIKEMLEDARQGRFPGTPKTDTSTIPSPCVAISPTPDSSSFFGNSPVESDRPMRKLKPEVKPVPESRSEPIAAIRPPQSPPTASSKSHANELPAVTVTEPVAAIRAPRTPPTASPKSRANELPAVTVTEPVAAIRAPQSPPTATSTSHATGRPTMTLAAARAAAAKKSSGAPVGIVKINSPSSQRHAPSSPPWNSPPPSSRTAERAAAVSTKSSPASTSRPPAQVVVEPMPAKASSNPSPASYKKTSSPGLKSPSSSPPPLRQTEQPTSPPWNIKLRSGGVKPRSGNGSPATASSVPTEREEFAAPAFASAGEMAGPVASEKAPTLLKQYSHGKKSGRSTAGNGDVAPSSAPMVRFPRNSSTPPTSGSSAGAAAAVIGASHGPKASALAAAFENKTRSRQVPPSAGTSGGNGSGSSLSREESSGSDGSGRGVDVRQRSGMQSRARSAPVEQVAPEKLVGKGSVMQKTQMYVAAAKKGSQGAAVAVAKEAPAAQLEKGKKGKEGSILDKLVSMFTVSPESTPSSSPTRSASRSPQGKPRSPMGANGAAANGASTPPFENARLGFFHTNKSFKMDSVDKE